MLNKKSNNTKLIVESWRNFINENQAQTELENIGATDAAVQSYVATYMKNMGRMLNIEWTDTSYRGNTDRKYMLKMIKYREVCEEKGIDKIEIKSWDDESDSPENKLIEEFGLDHDAIQRYNSLDTKFSINQLKEIINLIDQKAFDEGAWVPMEIDPETNQYK